MTAKFRVNNGLITDGDISFEGATKDGFETSLSPTDPTATRTITIPDASGDMVVSGANQDISVGSIETSGNITFEVQQLTILKLCLMLLIQQRIAQ